MIHDLRRCRPPRSLAPNKVWPIAPDTIADVGFVPEADIATLGPAKSLKTLVPRGGFEPPTRGFSVSGTPTKAVKTAIVVSGGDSR